MTQTNLPVAFAQNPKPGAFAALATESLAEGIGSSYGVIGYKGKVWSLRYRGEKKTFLRPDDGTPAGAIDVVILRQAHNKSKSFYEQYDPDQSDGKRPVCSSLNGIIPDADVTQKQAEACALCPRNVWKTDANGRKTRDCTDYKRLAVLVMPALTRAMLGEPLMEPVFLRVPPASLDNLAKMGETMAGQGWHFSSFVTRITFDPDQPHPKMIFTPVQPLTDQEAPAILALRNDVQAERITGEDQSGAGQRPLLSTVQPAPQIAPAPVQPSPQPAPAPARTTGFLELTANPAAVAVPSSTPPAAVAAPASQSATESDDALNARIANILKQNV